MLYPTLLFHNLPLQLDRLIRFKDPDDQSKDPPEDDPDDIDPDDKSEEKKDKSKDKSKDKKIEWTKDQQAELDRRAGAIKQNAEAKAKRDLENEQERIKEEAEKESLKAQGKFKEAAEKSEKAKEAAEQRAKDAEAKAKTLELQNAFIDSAESLKYGFVTKQAAQDAFSFINTQYAETVGEDGAGMEKALEKLKEDRPWLFDDSTNEDDDSEDNNHGTDAKSKGKTKKEQITKDKESEIKQRFRIRSPR